MRNKLDQDFKREVDEGSNELWYIIKSYGYRIIIYISIAAILISLANIVYKKTISKWEANAEREVFKETVAYTEQAASFLAKSYKEYNEAETKSDKKTIMEYVVMRYPNLDTDTIENDTLKQFYIKCLNNY